jgi:hypothetical protein
VRVTGRRRSQSRVRSTRSQRARNRVAQADAA